MNLQMIHRDYVYRKGLAQGKLCSNASSIDKKLVSLYLLYCNNSLQFISNIDIICLLLYVIVWNCISLLL